MKRSIIRLYLTIRFMIVSFCRRKDLHIGTEVIFNDNEYIVADLTKFTYFSRKVGIRRIGEFKPSMYVDSFAIRKAKGFDNWRHDVFYIWNWYKRNWFDIDTRCLLKKKPVESVRIVKF